MAASYKSYGQVVSETRDLPDDEVDMEFEGPKSLRDFAVGPQTPAPDVAISVGDPIWSRLEGYVQPDQRGAFLRVVAGLERLDQKDILVTILNAMGILATIIRQAPADAAAVLEKARGIERGAAALEQAIKGVETRAQAAESRARQGFSNIETEVNRLIAELTKASFSARPQAISIAALDAAVKEFRLATASLKTSQAKASAPAPERKGPGFVIGIICGGMVTLVLVFIINHI